MDTDPADRAGTQTVAGAAIASLIVLTTSMSLATLVFSGPLSGALGLGVTGFLVGTATLNLAVARGSRFPGAVAQPQDATTAIAATTVAGVAASVAADERIATSLAVLVMTTVTAGVCLHVLGRLRLGGLATYVPQPVLGGFIAGTGWLLLVATVGLARDGATASVAMLNITLGALLGLTLLLAARTRLGGVAFPGVLALGTVVVHVVRAVSGSTLATARADGLLASPPEGPLVPPGGLGEVAWSAVLGAVPTALAIAVVAALALLLNLGALGATLEEDIDVDAELRAVGAGNVLAGLTGASVGYHGLGATLVGVRLGARSRLTPLLTAGACVVVAVVGRDVLALLPVAVLAAIPAMIGFDLLDWGVRRGWRRMPRDEYALMIAIVLAVVGLGFLAGVVVGLVATSLLFVLAYARRDPVRASYTAADRPSSRERGPEQADRLRAAAERVHVVELEGHLFFGSVTAVATAVERELSAGEVDLLLVDVAAVPRIDSSAATALATLGRTCAAAGAELVICGADDRRRHVLDAVVTDAVELTAADVDHVIEEWEDRRLAEAGGGTDDEVRAPVGALARRLATWEELVALLPSVQVRAGDVVAETSSVDPTGEAWVVRSGQVTAEVPRPDGSWRRVAAIGAGGIVGEVRLYAGVARSARLRADTDCLLHPLTTATLVDLERRDPLAAATLHRAVAALLAERLAAVNRLRRSTDW